MNEAELLFTEILNCNRLSLYLNKEHRLDRDKTSLVSEVLQRRINGEPIQYILGKTEFMSLEFHLNQDVFIPRPETEILVETALRLVSSVKCQVSSVNILEIGTGSGCIAISLARLLNNIKITATDISQKALEVAEGNARINNVGNRISFVQSDLFTIHDSRPPAGEAGFTRYDLIISNPPYIPSDEIKGLQREIQYEPTIALDGGRDGLDLYRKIIAEAPNYLKEKGLLIMEMGFGQRGAIENIFRDSGSFQVLEVVGDYSNIDRVIVAKIYG